MKSMIVRFVREDAGQDMIEYALVAGVISVVAILAINSISGKVGALWTAVDTALPAGS
jgi:pilus assembly protein Flp/PilA